MPLRPEAPPALDAAEHRRLGAGLYNYTWTLMEKSDRTAAETDLMIESAHASAFHWMQIGALNNRARGHWLCSRVYAVAGRPEPSLWHARRCLELVEAGGEGFEDWERGSALEAVARASAIAGDRAESDRYKALAEAELPKIAEADDREVLEKDLASIPSTGLLD
jgi:hypothetical protein